MIDERIEALTQSVELITSLHKDSEKRMVLMLDAIARLTNIAGNHGAR